MGSYNISLFYEGSQNYTISSNALFVNVISAPDNSLPNLNIISPLNNTNYSFVQTSINYSVYDLNLQSCWYSLNNGLTNISVSCGTNVTALNSGQGTSNWTVYANDSAGNVGFVVTSFNVDSIAPSVQFVNPTLVSGVSISSSSFSVNLTASDNNLANITV